MDLEAEMRQQALGMISRAVRLPNSYRHLPGQSRKQDRALHLCAGDWTRVGEPAQRAAANREGETVASFLNIRSHLFERLRHATPRAPPERCISRERRGERLPG